MSQPLPEFLQAAAETGDVDAVLGAALTHFGCQAGTVHLLRGGVLKLAAHRNIPPPVVQIVETVPIGKGIAGLAAELVEPLGGRDFGDLTLGPFDREPVQKLAERCAVTGLGSAVTGFKGSPALRCVMTGLFVGSTATIFSPGLRGLSTSPQPVIVPPVPTPLTMMSTLPSVSRHISSAVVLRCTSGFAGFLNCCGIK